MGEASRRLGLGTAIAFPHVHMASDLRSAKVWWTLMVRDETLSRLNALMHDLHRRRRNGRNRTSLRAAKDNILPADYVADLFVRDVQRQVEGAARGLGGRIGRALGLKFAPRLHFRYDQAERRAERILSVIKQLNKEADANAAAASATSGEFAARSDGR